MEIMKGKINWKMKWKLGLCTGIVGDHAMSGRGELPPFEIPYTRVLQAMWDHKIGN